MAENNGENAEGNQSVPEKRLPRINHFTAKGIRTSRDFANLMNALMCDLIDKRVGPEMGSAICLAGGRLLRIIEMEHRYGSKNGEAMPNRVLTLSGEE